jgi:hypothetical protein
MIVRLVSYGVRECRHAVIDRETERGRGRERERGRERGRGGSHYPPDGGIGGSHYPP